MIQEMIYKVKMSKWDIHPSKTCLLCVSPDYSSIVTQHLCHGLSMDGECFHVEAVNVPFPDESPESYKEIFTVNYTDWVCDWENFILCEAGVIRGGNYTWITDIMEKYTSNISEVVAKGATQLQRSFYLVHLGDWISFYLAEMNGVDVVEVNVIDYLKGELAKV